MHIILNNILYQKTKVFCTAFVHSFEIEKSNLRHKETHQQCKTKSYLGAIHKYLLKDQRKGGREGGGSKTSDELDL